MGMGMYKIVEQMVKINPENQANIVTLEKLLIVTPNYWSYGHPPVTPSNLGANLTLLEHNEPLFHTCYELLP